MPQWQRYAQYEFPFALESKGVRSQTPPFEDAKKRFNFLLTCRLIITLQTHEACTCTDYLNKGHVHHELRNIS